MKVYLVEVLIKKKLHPIAIKTNWELGHNLLAGRAGLITEMILDKEYPEGIGVCEHWHFEKNEEDEEKCPISGVANCAECSERQIKECSGDEDET